jgi:hypothetical protein
VCDVAVSRDFYADVLGREVVLEEIPPSSRSPTAGSS